MQGSLDFRVSFQSLFSDFDESGLDDSVALVVGDIIIQPQEAVGVHPAVGADHGSVVEPVLLPDLPSPRLVLEEPSISNVILDVVLGGGELGGGRRVQLTPAPHFSQRAGQACGKKNE